jgi:hypothetical protein
MDVPPNFRTNRPVGVASDSHSSRRRGLTDESQRQQARLYRPVETILRRKSGTKPSAPAQIKARASSCQEKKPWQASAAPETLCLRRPSTPEEVAKFSAMAADWWDPESKFAPLHKFNPARLTYIRDTLAAHFGRSRAQSR